jgi:hypothetical protein
LMTQCAQCKKAQGNDDIKYCEPGSYAIPPGVVFICK